MGGTTRSGGRARLASLRGHRYMNLTTFRRNGEGVRTPVWFAEGASDADGGELYVYTMGDSGKAKRIRNGGGVLVGPSDRRGVALGPEELAVARILLPAEEGIAEAALDRKYGLKKRAFGLLLRALGKAGGRVYLGIAAPPEDAARTTDARKARRQEVARILAERGAEQMEAKGEEIGTAAPRRSGGAAPFRRSGWALDVLFAVAATLLLAATGALVATGALPWVVPGEESALVAFYESLPAWGRAAFGTWQATATLLGLALPAIAVTAWGRRGDGARAVRGALAPYALILLWQVLVEAAFARVFFPSIVVFTGMIFTAYRIWQLSRSRRTFAASPAAAKLPARARRPVGALLSASLVFWGANLAFLLTVMAPRVTGF